MSFYLVIEGKEDEDEVRKQESIEKLELEHETSQVAMKATLDNIQRLQSKAKMIQWEKKQSLGQDMFRMEATLCKLKHTMCDVKTRIFIINYIIRDTCIIEFKCFRNVTNSYSNFFLVFSFAIAMVDKWSLIHFMIIGCIAILQVYTIRSMFLTST